MKKSDFTFITISCLMTILLCAYATLQLRNETESLLHRIEALEEQGDYRLAP